MTLTSAGNGLVLPAALTAATVGLWATGRLPEYLVALLFFAAAVTLRVAPVSMSVSPAST